MKGIVQRNDKDVEILDWERVKEILENVGLYKSNIENKITATINKQSELR